VEGADLAQLGKGAEEAEANGGYPPLSKIPRRLAIVEGGGTGCDMDPGGEVSELEVAGREVPGRYGMVALVEDDCAEGPGFRFDRRNGDTQNGVAEVRVNP
jgi:hypothetical protein